MSHGLRSQRRKAPYTKESLSRALTHHSLTGALRHVSPPSPGRPQWGIGIPGLDTVELTTPQVYGLCLGLAAGERAYKAKGA